MASETDESIRSMDMERIKKHLFQIAMKSEWNEVFRVYMLNPKAHEVKITKTGDTALHIAVSDGQEEHVERLVELVSKDNLERQNEQGNTALHIAALMGNVQMCACIAEKHQLLAAFPNNEEETPLFLAALYGKKDAFLCLHDILDDPQKQGYDHCRRRDGDTILHCAIAGDYFDLAFQIIHLYKDLVNSFNEEGASPLHLLATKPSAFRSGSNLGLVEKIIYDCIYVDELKVEGQDRFNQGIIKTFKEEKDPKYPENYHTCMNFIRLFWNFFRVVTFIPAYWRRGTKPEDAENPDHKAQGHQSYPENYSTCFAFVKFVKFLSKAMLVVFGLVSREILKIRERKEKHKWSVQIMNELLKYSSTYKDEESGMRAQSTEHNEETLPDELLGGDVIMRFPDIGYTKDHYGSKQKTTEGSSRAPEQNEQSKLMSSKRETPILIATMNGVTEMVETILEIFPLAVHDMNIEKKNIVLLAVEYRQPHVYQLLKRNIFRESMFNKVDLEGNSALHLAAKLGEHKPWRIPGAALQMQWEMKWYEFVKTSMPLHFFARYNKEGRTAQQIFNETHKDLMKAGAEWLYMNSISYFAVGGFVIPVGFASATAIPGGIKEGTGKPTLVNQPDFEVFAIASLVAVCFSVISMMMFLAIITSSFQAKDFEKDLPRKLLLGSASLFVAIVSILISFCAGHFSVLKDKLKYAAFPLYAITFLSVALFAINHLHRYINLMSSIVKKVPQPVRNDRTPVEGFIYI